jgi:hypothetical protein
MGEKGYTYRLALRYRDALEPVWEQLTDYDVALDASTEGTWNIDNPDEANMLIQAVTRAVAEHIDRRTSEVRELETRLKAEHLKLVKGPRNV